MTKKDIVRQIAERVDLTQLKTKEVVQQTFDAIIETLVQEGRIELRKFGVFEVRRREGRTARNPKTSKTVYVEPKLVVVFQPGKEMEERVRQEGQNFQKKRKRRKPGDLKSESDGQEVLVPSAASEAEE